MTTPWRASCAPRSMPRGSSRSIPAGRAWRRRPRRRRSTTGTTPTAEAEPAARAERVAAFVRAADGLETAGFCSTEGVEAAFANSAGQRAHRPLDERACSTGSPGPAARTERRGPHRRSSRDLDGAAAGEEATRAGPRRRRRHRPRARPLRGGPVARVRRRTSSLPGASTASTAAPSRRAARSPASARRSSTLPSRSPTTSPTRWRSASASTPRERRSAATSS